jgi:hypothetical protein
MTEAVDLSEALIKPVVLAMVQSAGMDEDKRAKLIASTLAQAIDTADLYLMQGATLASLNEAMLQAHAIIQAQSEELLRFAIDGADVDADLIRTMETVQ